MIGLFERFVIGLLLMMRGKRGQYFEQEYPEFRKDTDEVNLYSSGEAFFAEIPGLGLIVVDRDTAAMIRPQNRTGRAEIKVNMLSEDLYSDTLKNLIQELAQRLQQGG